MFCLTYFGVITSQTTIAVTRCNENKVKTPFGNRKKEVRLCGTGCTRPLFYISINRAGDGGSEENGKKGNIPDTVFITASKMFCRSVFL
ncbi:hypothetical protein NC653_013660 [Populus alba x Populus x berolinensis]|uniref:Uncharacterized protein n=1 Tax=Populus alba x Populus x berolinensis TaxID=444605 RepID=A0AAD6QV68_9ROSI|nr:hypothetical protein NC653_013660 [Populus alba x Populus x berolinensis]